MISWAAQAAGAECSSGPAPDVDFNSKNNADLYGSMLFRSIFTQNTLDGYYDIESGSVVSATAATSGVSVVR